MLSIGIDFGTTNTVVAAAAPDGTVEGVAFTHDGLPKRIYTTALSFAPGTAQGPKVEGGPFAIDDFLEGLDSRRFMQSFKTFAASHTFQDTRIFRARFLFEDLLTVFLRTFLRHTGLDLKEKRVVVGRPVRFAGGNPDDALAMRRYGAAFSRFEAATRYVYEPVGAAFFFARDLPRDATVLVADFGGGTSDFSVLRFAGQGGTRRATPLAHAGIGIAGDAFDARIMDHVVAPCLGQGSHYRSMGDKRLALPRHYWSSLARWDQLALLRNSQDMRDLAGFLRMAEEPEAIERFLAIVETESGFPLYRAVAATKFALSTETEADFVFTAPGLDFAISDRVRRADFEAWIAEDIARIAATLDEVLGRAKLRPADIDHVFLTGGTSFVPAVRGLFLNRFGEARLTSADQFESIAYGLALIGQSPDGAAWSIADKT